MSGKSSATGQRVDVKTWGLCLFYNTGDRVYQLMIPRCGVVSSLLLVDDRTRRRRLYCSRINALLQLSQGIMLQPAKSSRRLLNIRSRLRDVERLGQHATAVYHKKKHNGVDLEQACPNRAVGDLILQPPLRSPERHETGNCQARRDGKTLKVFGLPSRVLGYASGRNVESCKTSQTRQHESRQQQLVQGRTAANGETTRSRSNAERDLWQSEKVTP